MLKKVVFLDMDGVIVDLGYISFPQPNLKKETDFKSIVGV